jgi:hypothetical protein
MPDGRGLAPFARSEGRAQGGPRVVVAPALPGIATLCPAWAEGAAVTRGTARRGQASGTNFSATPLLQ